MVSQRVESLDREKSAKINIHLHQLIFMENDFLIIIIVTMTA